MRWRVLEIASTYKTKKRRARMDSQEEGRAYKKQCLKEKDKRRAYLCAVITHIRSSLGEHTLRAHTSRAIADSYNEFKEKRKQKNLMQCDDLLTTKGFLGALHHLPITQVVHKGRYKNRSGFLGLARL